MHVRIVALRGLQSGGRLHFKVPNDSSELTLFYCKNTVLVRKVRRIPQKKADVVAVEYETCPDASVADKPAGRTADNWAVNLTEELSAVALVQTQIVPPLIVGERRFRDG